MQQQRLMRSRTEVVISGVCGGLGEYFGVDPVIVRLIFALVTLTTGIGFIIYPALWIAMPKAPVLPGQPALGGQQPFDVVQRERERASVSARYGETPASSYKYDPLTGEPIQPSMGETTQLPYDPTEYPMQPAPVPARQRKLGRWFAFGIIALGFLILADQIGLGSEFVFPLILIGIGVFLLRRK